MKPNSFIRTSLALAGSSLLAIPSAHAQTGTWNVDANGLWGTDTNWASNTIADGLTSTANFTNNITADRTVSLDTDRTINRVNFADPTVSSAGSWILDNNGVSTNNLILSGTTGAASGTVPVIDVAALGSGKTATISAIIEGSYGFTKAGAGTLVLSGNNTYTGVTTHGSGNGITIVAHDNALGSTAAGSHTEITLSGTDNRYIGINNGVNTAENFTIFGSSTSGSTAIRGMSGTATLSGTITMDGNGQTRLGGTSATLIWAGTITQVSSKSYGLLFYGNNTISNAMTINGGSLTAVSGTVTLNGVNPTDGTGLGDAGTFGGSFTLGVTNALRTDGNFSFAGGASNLNLNGNNQTIKGLISTASTGYTVNNNASSSTSTLTVGNGGGDYSFGGVIRNNTTGTGILALVKTGAGNQTLIGTNIFTGGTRIDDGTLTLGHATDTLSNTGAVNVNGGTLALGTNTDTVGAVTLTSGNITGSGTALQGVLTGTSYDVRSGSVSAKLAGTGVALTKTTGGTVTLSAANTYTGATNVNGGVLAVNGSLANTTTTIGNGGTLQGSGSIGGSVTIQNGGTLATGNSIESLGTGTLSLDAGSTFAYEIDRSAAAGVAGDLTYVTGDLNIASGAILTLTELGLSGTWDLADKLTLISYTGTWNNGLLTYLGNEISDDSTLTYQGITWLLNYNDTLEGMNYTADSTGNFVTMTVTAIPEPATALLGCLGLLLLLRRRR